MEIFEIKMETFTLGTAIGLIMNVSFYVDSVDAAAWSKAKRFFLVVVFLLVKYSLSQPDSVP